MRKIFSCDIFFRMLYWVKIKTKYRSGNYVSVDIFGCLRFFFYLKTERRMYMVEFITNVNSAVNGFVWGVPMLVLLVGTGILMTILTKFFQLSHLGHWFKNTVGGIFHDKHVTKHTEAGDQSISQFQSLCTALAATIGTGNIVGVASALVAGGPGAIFWMWVVAFFGMMTNYSENVLGIYYRRRNSRGEWSGGAMYYLKDGLGSYKGCKQIGAVLAVLFSAFCLLASFGIGNMTQANSISGAVQTVFGVPVEVCGVILTVLSLIIILGGIKTISKVSSVVVPGMAVFYIIAGFICILINIQNVPHGLYMIFMMAFNPQAIGGGVLGTITVTVMNSMRYGVARGCFSNEAGLGSAAITAAAATTDDPVRQGYINMTGTFWDTIVVCSITGLTIASSGVLGTTDASGAPLKGIALTMAAFSTQIGIIGTYIVAIGIILFAYSTIIGWEYHGEKAWEYLFGTHKFNMVYRIIFSLVVYVGATQTLDLVWNLSDIANALMAIPNLISLLVLSPVIKEEVVRFQAVLEREKAEKAAAKEAAIEERAGI